MSDDVLCIYLRILVSNTIPMSDDVLCIYSRILVSNTIPMLDGVFCIYLRILVSNTIPMSDHFIQIAANKILTRTASLYHFMPPPTPNEGWDYNSYPVCTIMSVFITNSNELALCLSF